MLVAEMLEIPYPFKKAELFNLAREALKTQFRMKMKWPVLHRLIKDTRTDKYYERIEPVTL